MWHTCSPAGHVTGQPVLFGWQLSVMVAGSWHMISCELQVTNCAVPSFFIFVCRAHAPLLSWTVLIVSANMARTVIRDTRIDSTMADKLPVSRRAKSSSRVSKWLRRSGALTSKRAMSDSCSSQSMHGFEWNVQCLQTACRYPSRGPTLHCPSS